MPPGRFSIVAALSFALLVPACGRQPDARRPVGERPRGPRVVAPLVRAVLDASAALDRTRPSVVVVECLDRRRNVVAQGSGVVVGDNTIVTAWPLISRAFSVRVRDHDRTRNAVIVAVLEGQGIARLRVRATDAIELGRDTLPLAGATVFAVGAAQGTDLSATGGMTTGLREAKARGIEHIAFTAEAPSGFTGGALLDSTGTLIGIVASTRAGDALSLAVPVRHVKDLLALPDGTLPKVTVSPLNRLPPADRRWLVDFMTRVATRTQPLSGLGLARVNALLDRLDPLVGRELDRVKIELGFGLLDHQRLVWEDAVEARAFGRAVKSTRRLAKEEDLLKLGVLGRREVAQWDAILRSVALREPFDVPGARVTATEGYLAQMLTHTDQARRLIEMQLWEARSR